MSAVYINAALWEKTLAHDAIVVKCCTCHRVRRVDGWVHEAGSGAADKVYSHSYCPACLVQAYANMDPFEACAS